MGKVQIEFYTSNAGFEEYGSYQMSEVVEQIKRALESGTSKKIIDINGNTIGTIEIIE